MTDARRSLPTGTVTFVFTDIADSTRAAASHPEAFARALALHNRLVREVIDRHDGKEVRTQGDSFFVVFVSAEDAVSFTAEAQRRLLAAQWPKGAELQVRMGMHTGSAELAESESDDYVGVSVHRAARVSALAHPCQILLSEATAGLVRADDTGFGLRDLGVHRLKGLADPERLYQLVVDGLPEDFPDLPDPARVANNLPGQLTSFVGRDQTVRSVLDVIAEHRLVTLTGPGGTGKTRLAIRVGHEALDLFRDGVFFVDLASVSDEGLVSTEILATLKIRVPGRMDPSEYLTEYLAARSVLLILDNLEQIPRCGTVVSTLLRGAPAVTILATSRRSLRVTGEREFPIPPLQVPAGVNGGEVEEVARSEAVALFVDRARQVDPAFAIGPENVESVVALVKRLDGLPLAIELAAARVRSLPVSVIYERLGAGMLTGGSIDLPERQQSIAAAIRWSHDLLPPGAARLFRRLAVFEGGAGFEEIEAVCGPDLGGEVLDCVTELVDQSLVISPRTPADQFTMLVVIREFALERLEEAGEGEKVRDRHSATYADLAESAGPHFVTSGQAAWLDRISVDHENIRAALSSAVARGRADDALRLVGGIWRFWQIRGHLVEAADRIDEALAMPGGETTHRLAALEAAGGIAYWRGDPRIEQFYDEAVDLARGSGDGAALANALYNQSFPYAIADTQRSLACLDEAIEIWKRLGDPVGVARAHWGMGNTYQLVGDLEQSLDHFEKSIDGFRGADRPFDLGWSLFTRAFVLLQMGRDAEMARESLAESFAIFEEARDVTALVLHLGAFASAALSGGDRIRAFHLAGAMTRIVRHFSIGLADMPENAFPGMTPTELERLEGAEGEAYAAGLALSLEDAIALGRAEGITQDERA